MINPKIKDKKRLLVVLGPTATGKTDLALKLAYKFQGELISADSRQVYTGLDIGTGKLPSEISNVKSQMLNLQKAKGWWKINGVKIWMYDVIDLKKQYTVADYVKDSNKVIDDILKRGKLPIIVGGSGLYLKALIEGLSNLVIPIDQKLKKQLNNLTIKQLQQKLQAISPEKWKNLNQSDKQNPRRLSRAIELASTNFTSDGGPKGLLRGGFNILKIGLIAPREILNQKINNRAVEWLNKGIVLEVRKLIESGITKKRIKELGLEYAVIVEYLDKRISLDQCLKKMQSKVRQYAKRQITWFKNPSTSSGYIYWFDITSKDSLSKLEKLVRSWYDSLKGSYVTEN